MLIPHLASPTICLLTSDSLRAVHATLTQRTAAVGDATADALGAMVAEDDGDRRRALLARLHELSREAVVYRQHMNTIEAEPMARERTAGPTTPAGRLIAGLLAGDGDAEAARAALLVMERGA